MKAESRKTEPAHTEPAAGTIAAGQRNTELTRLAGAMRRRGFDGCRLGVVVAIPAVYFWEVTLVAVWLAVQLFVMYLYLRCAYHIIYALLRDFL